MFGHEVEQNNMATYIKATEVISPKAHWHLFDVILDRGEGDCAYALGTWDGERRIGFRWNGSKDTGSIGSPQSRGLPTWTILDPALHDAIVALLSPEKQSLSKRFLGLSTNAAYRQEFLRTVREFHQAQVAKIASDKPPVPTLGGGLLVMHAVPVSANNPATLPSDEIFKRPEKFPPIGIGHPNWSKIDFDGLLIGSNAEGPSKPQRAYVRVFRSGKIEAVASSLARGRGTNSIILPTIQAMIIKYAQNYTSALHSCGVAPPVAIIVSLAGVKGMRLLQDFAENAFVEDMPQAIVAENIIQFSPVFFDTVPTGYNESAKALMPLLSHLAHAAGLASPPYFDIDGNYMSKLL